MYIVGTALSAISSLCTPEMAQDLYPEVERLISVSNSYLKKKVRDWLIVLGDSMCSSDASSMPYS